LQTELHQIYFQHCKIVGALKKLAGQTAIYGLSSIVGRLLNYFLVPWYTRIFSQAEYGIVTDLYAYAVVFLILLTYGMETAFFNFSKTEEHKSSVYTTSLVSLFATSLLFILLAWLFREPLGQAMGYTNKSVYILWFAIIIGFDAFLSLPFAYLRLQGKSLQFASIKLFSIGINIFFNVLFLLILPNYFKQGNLPLIAEYFYQYDLVAYVFISNLLASSFTTFLLLPVIIKHGGTFSFPMLKRMLVYSAPLLVAGLAGSVNEVFDRILLKYLLVIPETVSNAGEYVMSQIGIYGANYKLSIIMTLFIQTFRYAFEPFFFSQADKKDSRDLYALIMKYFIIFGLAIFLFVISGIGIFQYFIGESFRAGLNIVPILLLANLFLGIVFNLSLWYKLSAKTIYGAYIAIIGAFITLLFNVILIPIMGYTGSAWATLICYVSMAIISLLWGQKHYKIDYPVQAIVLYIIFALIIYTLGKVDISETAVYQYTYQFLLFVVFVGTSVFIELKKRRLGSI